MNTKTAHTRGKLRDDGLIFWQYKKYKTKGGERRKYEVWLTPQKFKENKDRVEKSYKEYYAKNQARLAAKRAAPENKESKRKYAEEYRRKNKKLVKASKAKWARKPETKARKRQLSAKYRKTQEYRAKVVQHEKERMIRDPNFLLAKRSRARLRSALKMANVEKSQRTQEYIGCSYSFLKKHIEGQFKIGMTWKNPSSFHIDHIRPVSSFDLLDPEQLKLAFHWTNLQPLTPEENMKKGAIFRLQD
jgi:hypothetical protein